jgi:hypothetical protein
MSMRPGRATGPAQPQPTKPMDSGSQPGTALMRVAATHRDLEVVGTVHTVDGELVVRVRPGREPLDVTARRMGPRPDPTTLAHGSPQRHQGLSAGPGVARQEASDGRESYRSVPAPGGRGLYVARRSAERQVGERR